MINYAKQAQRLDTLEKTLADEPGIQHDLMVEVLRVIRSQTDTERVGRRLPPESMGFEEVWALLHPERFHPGTTREAMLDLIGKETQRDFAARVPCSQAVLGRLLSGLRDPSIEMLESLAEAGGVTPAYFEAWRRNFLVNWLDGCLQDRSRDTARLFKQVLGSRL